MLGESEVSTSMSASTGHSDEASFLSMPQMYYTGDHTNETSTGKLQMLQHQFLHEDHAMQTDDSDVDEQQPKTLKLKKSNRYIKKHQLPIDIVREDNDMEQEAESPVRRGFVRIYFENANFTSSTVLRVEENTLVREVRQIMGNKMRLSSRNLEHHAIVMIYATGKGPSMSARTLRDTESIFQVQEAIHTERQSLPEIAVNENMGPVRVKPRHRARQTLKFVFKDTRLKPIDIDADLEKQSTNSQDAVFILPQKLGVGTRCGLLKKASLKDVNVWRTRWFVLKEDKLYYCKSETNQRDITSIALLNACIVKADVQIPHCFELHTSRRVYRLCAETDDSMVTWIHALHREIRLAAENQVLTKAEIFIVDEAVTSCERTSPSTPFAAMAVLGNPSTRKVFRDFLQRDLPHTTILLDAWIECDNFRHTSQLRYQTQLQSSSTTSTTNTTTSIQLPRSTSNEEWDHVKAILLQYIPASLKVGAQLQEVELDIIRNAYHESQRHRRLSIAMDADASLLHVEYPSPQLYVNVQNDLLRSLDEGPFRHFIAGNGYSLIVDRIIRR